MKFTSENTAGTLNPAYRHGKSNSSTYRVWSGMLTRCGNPNTRAYADYGGRGIRVCERWLDFALFFADMGERPSSGHSIDRIDNDGNYEPANCRWATRKEQNNNSRHNRLITINGISKTLEDWANYAGFVPGTLNYRLKMGWHESELLLPARTKRSAYVTGR
jgi:hypothetical protein